MIVQKYKDMLSGKSVIRQLSEFATARGAEIGYENVFDYSLGNPSVPVPKEFTERMIHMLATQEPNVLHGYSPSLGITSVREAIDYGLSPQDFYEERHARIYECILEIANEGKTVVMVLHDLAQAFAYADEIVLMSEGRCLMQGTPESVYNSGKINEIFNIEFCRMSTSDGWKYFYKQCSIYLKNASGNSKKELKAVGFFMAIWYNERKFTSMEGKEETFMIKEKIVVKNPIGVHLRPAGDIAEAAIKFKKCEVYLTADGRSVNGKSLLSILSLGIQQGSEFEIVCNGQDEEAAMKAILAAVEKDL